MFHRPAGSHQTPFDELLDRLEEFWDSEVPRVGETGATGWKSWEAAGKHEAISVSSTPVRKSTALDPFVRWAQDELASCRSIHSLPARNSSGGPNSDPYAIILFSDIRPFMLDLHSLQAKQKFRLIWVSFLGIHIPGLVASLHEHPTLSADDRWSATHFSAPEFLVSLFPPESGMRQLTADACAGVLVGREREFTNVFGPVKYWNFGMVDASEFIGDGGYTMIMREDLVGVDSTITREILRHCRLPPSDAEWDALHIAIEGALDPKA